MIRPATLDDAAACRRIYAPYIERTNVTLETVVPSTEEFRERIRATAARYPYLVWEEGGQVLAYVYAQRYRPRAACDWICESGLYVDEATRGRGIGRKLYLKLFECLRVMNMVSVIGVMRSNMESAAFHERMGFVAVGRIPFGGYKLGKWCDLAFWQYELQSSPPMAPSPVIPFPQVRHLVSFE